MSRQQQSSDRAFVAKPQSDLQAFYDALRPYYLNPQHGGDYSFEDRFRDFRKVFVESGEPGRRVLAQILDECEGKPTTLNQVRDHAYLAWRAGKREVGLWIVAAMSGVPPMPDMGEGEDE